MHARVRVCLCVCVGVRVIFSYVWVQVARRQKLMADALLGGPDAGQVDDHREQINVVC